MKLDINELRKEINEIDNEMVELFKKRMEVAASIAEYKKEHSLPVLDAARERALLERISVMAGDELGGYVRYSYTKGSCIIIRSEDNTFVLGLKESSDTKALYEALVEKTAE